MIKSVLIDNKKANMLKNRDLMNEMLKILGATVAAIRWRATCLHSIHMKFHTVIWKWDAIE